MPWPIFCLQLSVFRLWRSPPAFEYEALYTLTPADLNFVAAHRTASQRTTVM